MLNGDLQNDIFKASELSEWQDGVKEACMGSCDQTHIQVIRINTVQKFQVSKIFFKKEINGLFSK